jgi:geranylgeranyl reductase family protein
MLNDYDVAIIGAGPCGCACALALQGSGLRVVLLDKEVFPRDKVCGDAIPGASFKAMDHINTELGKQMRQFADKMDITASTVYFSKTKSITYNWLAYSYNSRRIDFDNFLIQLVRKETETNILEKKRLQKITVETDYVLCQFQDNSSLKASIIIGCDGANSIVKRQLGTTDPRENDSAAAIRAYYRDIGGIKKGENEFHIIKDLVGYFWIFPLQNGLSNIGFGVMKNRNSKKTKSPKDLRSTLDQIIRSPEFENRFKNAELTGNVNGFGLPIWTKKRCISGNRFMLCGDAAYLIDPLQGHGIDKAMWSGVFAAKQVKNCFELANFTGAFMKQYDNMLYKKMGRELLRSYIMMRNFLRFPFLVTFFLRLNPNQNLINWFARKLKI